MQLPPEIDAEVAELERRLGAVLADPDPATIGARAAVAFADHRPAWPTSVFASADIQLAAPDADAIAAGDYLAVIGDVHPGDNPLGQGLFAHRHPDPAAFQELYAADAGSGVPLLLPPLGPGMGVDARGAPLTPESFVHIAVMPDTRAQGSRRTWLPTELFVDGDEVVDATGALRLSVFDVFGLPIFITAVRTFELLPEQEHAPRVAIGRVVIQRESWSVPAAEVPQQPDAVPAFARERGMPRRVFTKSPLERKPIYVDTESQTLARILCRQARAAAADASDARIRFTEMLPAPEECWLADPDGNRYVSELRFVAVDGARRTP
jgi:hypothetical protein